MIPSELPYPLTPDMLDLEFLPSVFLSPHAEQAWAIALGGRREIGPTAQRLIATQRGAPLRQKKMKELELPTLLSDLYGSLAYTLGDPNRPFGWPSAVLLERNLSRLLSQVLPADAAESYVKAYSLAQITSLLRRHFPEALRLINLGLDARHYSSVLILPQLVERFLQIEAERQAAAADDPDAFAGKAHTQAAMALHILLCERNIPGLAGLALQRWPELEPEFGYAVAAQVLRNTVRHTIHPSLPSSVQALILNLREMGVGVVDYDNRNVSLAIFPRLQELARHAPANLRQVVSEMLQDVVLPVLQIVEPGAACPAIELREPPVIHDELIQLCDEILDLAPEDIVKSIKDAARVIERGEAKVAELRRKINALSAEGVKMDVAALTAATGQLASQSEALHAGQQQRDAGVNSLLQGLDAFVRRWNTACLEAQPVDELDVDSSRRLLDLEHELAESAQENHRLRSKLSALERLGSPSAHAPGSAALPVDLLRKVATRPEHCTPREVLEYLQLLAGDRLVVLPSAWKSADESERFEYSARMLELLDAVLFAYAPALASGTPDAEARKLLGAAYSSRESETTSKRDTFRRVRTFSFEGAPRYFGRHLRVGNCPGKARGMRIFFDIINETVVIAYCGQHLSVNGSN